MAVVCAAAAGRGARAADYPGKANRKMAIWQGSLTEEIRGKLGGVVFGNSTAGQTIRTRRKPISRFSQVKEDRRNLHAYNATIWRTLTSAQRTAWTNYAGSFTLTDSLGNPYYLTGYQAYMRWASIWDPTTGPPSTTAPASNGLPTPPVVALSASSDDLVLQSIVPALGTSDYLLLSVWAPVDASRSTPTYTQSTRLYLDSGDSIPYTLVSDYYARFASGTELTAIVNWRFVDQDRRQTALYTETLAITA